MKCTTTHPIHQKVQILSPPKYFYPTSCIRIYKILHLNSLLGKTALYCSIRQHSVGVSGKPEQRIANSREQRIANSEQSRIANSREQRIANSREQRIVTNSEQSRIANSTNSANSKQRIVRTVGIANSEQCEQCEQCRIVTNSLQQSPPQLSTDLDSLKLIT